MDPLHRMALRLKRDQDRLEDDAGHWLRELEVARWATQTDGPQRINAALQRIAATSSTETGEGRQGQ